MLSSEFSSQGIFRGARLQQRLPGATNMQTETNKSALKACRDLTRLRPPVRRLAWDITAVEFAGCACEREDTSCGVGIAWQCCAVSGVAWQFRLQCHSVAILLRRWSVNRVCREDAVFLCWVRGMCVCVCVCAVHATFLFSRMILLIEPSVKGMLVNTQLAFR